MLFGSPIPHWSPSQQVTENTHNFEQKSKLSSVGFMCAGPSRSGHHTRYFVFVYYWRHGSFISTKSCLAVSVQLFDGGLGVKTCLCVISKCPLTHLPDWLVGECEWCPICGSRTQIRMRITQRLNNIVVRLVTKTICKSD